jgi:hypothetical protein
MNRPFMARPTRDTTSRCMTRRSSGGLLLVRRGVGTGLHLLPLHHQERPEE